MTSKTLKIGYIPEHFSTPIYFAKANGYFAKNSLSVELISYPSGSGHLIQSLKDGSIDIAIGLTEAFIRGICDGDKEYSIVGTYVDSPLCWSISSGVDRDDITSPDDLNGKRVSVSRIGSGSYVMSFVLALQRKFSKPYFDSYPICHNFKNLRDSVNLKLPDNNSKELGNSDAFMWEYFTTKKYYDLKEIKKIGEIYTPWPSWVIVSSSSLLRESKEDVDKFLSSIQEGISYFVKNQGGSANYIYQNLDYSEEDAKSWLDTVVFSNQVSKIDWQKIVENTKKVLQEADVLQEKDEKIIDERLKEFVLSE
ncbi:substrate-binding domain-containing protein [Ascoidea rubescens DSM 1968]|uniref:Periplasmic binding protein-like II n=1 Tax=Ascoidea rubescens DSM 1968 TaxID=1344418 RepID=A0A1D2VHS8_9ASCO|nr:periplasmic binding protein-like II [Ascoidea rubescens DSM 1968]ODV61152.1 periplasmic binding protein-like II [Ascoidea rubescens DSM 1968]